MERPKFLSKKEREELALKKRQAEADLIKQKREEQLKARDSFFAAKQREDSVPSKSAVSGETAGKEEPKKKRNRNKFVFDWDANEDTLKQDDFLYSSRPTLVKFGTGKRSEKLELKDPMKHWTEKSLEEMQERDWRIIKEDFNISTKGGSIPHPLRFWHESEIPRRIVHAIEDIGYSEPTPIQRQAIPIALKNRDLIGIAETGSGKTASFLIPMLVYISELPRMNAENMMLGPYCLVLAPTRELAQQTEQEAQKFCARLGYRCVSIVGGHSLDEQSFNLRNGAEIIIATPGRLRDCLDRRILVLSQCTFVVMDEADRMVDMGFEDDVNFILEALPDSNIKPDSEAAENADALRKALNRTNRFRQTVMFSATMPPAVEKLARTYLRRPATIVIGQVGQTVDRIEQRVEMIHDEHKKRSRLLQILGSNEFPAPIIVFVNQKKSCEVIARSLEKDGYKTITLHGGKTQDQREASLSLLKQGKKDILVATDVAGRGIDIKDVSLVINYDMAKTIQDYTHRIGRTGRAGKHGTAITFLSYPTDEEVFYDLKHLLLKSPISKCPPELLNHEAARNKPAAPSGQVKRKADESFE